MSDDAAWAKEMGARLKGLRKRSGLSLDKVAERMGYQGRSRSAITSRLETGRTRNPSILTVTRYLNAVGAKYSEFYDSLTRVRPIPVEPVVREALARVDPKAEVLSAEVQEEVIRKTAAEQGRFERHVASPREGAPMPPARQRKASARLLEWNAQLNTVRALVNRYLQTTDVGAYDFHKYQFVVARLLSALRKSGTAGERQGESKRDRTPVNANERHEESKRGGTLGDATEGRSESAESAQSAAREREERRAEDAGLAARLEEIRKVCREEKLDMGVIAGIEGLVREAYARMQSPSASGAGDIEEK